MTLPLAAGTYRLDPLHSQIRFAVTHLGLTPITGLFPEFDGSLQVGDRLDDVGLEVSIRMSTVQSGHPRRDENLQPEEYFDSAKHPVMTFCSTSITAADTGWIINGELTIKGRTRPVRLEATMTGRKVFHADEKEHLGFVARGRLSRTAFGVGVGVPADILSDDIDIAIAAQLIAV